VLIALIALAAAGASVLSGAGRLWPARASPLEVK
jgi:hypothetical protein